MERLYKTILNQEIDLSASPEKVQEFLQDVFEAYENKAVNSKNLIKLVWSPMNPLLRTDLIEGKAFSTQETYEDPAFRVMGDLIDRKRLEEGALDLEKVREKFSMTVEEASQLHEVDKTTIRRAYHSDKIAGITVKGKIMLDPNSVKAWQATIIGRKAQKERKIHVGVGYNETSIFKIKPEIVKLEQHKEGKSLLIDGVLPDFKTAGILCGSKKKPRFYKIQASNKKNQIQVDEFHVIGKFDVIEEITNPAKAGQAYQQWVS